MFITFTLFCLVACQSTDDKIIKYGEMYNKDIEFANQFYDRVDSLITVSYGGDEWPIDKKHEARLENLRKLEAAYDYAQFRFNYYTTKGYKKIVDRMFENWNYCQFTGKYHTYQVYRKPSKKGIVHGAFIDIVD